MGLVVATAYSMAASKKDEWIDSTPPPAVPQSSSRIITVKTGSAVSPGPINAHIDSPGLIFHEIVETGRLVYERAA